MQYQRFYALWAITEKNTFILKNNVEKKLKGYLSSMLTRCIFNNEHKN